MAGVHFPFNSLDNVLQLSIGIAERLDENRVESFSYMYCDFSAVESDLIESSLEQVLRHSDSLVNQNKRYYFILPYTDKYGAVVVKNMFEEFFDKVLPFAVVAYPIDGETPFELSEALQAKAKKETNTDLDELDF